MNVKCFFLKSFALFVSTIIVLSACATGEATQNEAVLSADQTAQYEQAVRYEQELYNNVLRGILKMHNTFRGTTENTDIKLQFDFTDENFSILKSKYGLETIA
jgi:hypothetical protein